MIQPLTPIELNSIRALLASGIQKPRSISWGDIRYAKKAAPNLLRKSGAFVTAYEGKRVEFDLDGVRLYNASNVVTVNLDTVTGDGTFAGALSAATGTFSGSLSAATGTFAGSLSAATGTFAGSLSAVGGTFTGALSAATGTFAGSLSAATGTFAGNLSAAGGTFAGSLSAATGTFSGELSAATGTFSGSLSAATGTFAGSLSAATGTFSGSLSAASGTFGTITGGSIEGVTITGGIFRTAASGTRVELTSTVSERILFYGPTSLIGAIYGMSDGITMTGQRVVLDGIFLHQGTTYGLCGQTPSTRETINNLADGATLVQTVTKVNALMGMLRTKGHILGS